MSLLDHELPSARVDVHKRGFARRFLAFAGPAYLVSVGYMDPGNWATDIEAGARFGYTLLWVLLVSNMIALLLQTLAARFGIVTGLDLAQGCRREYPRPIGFLLWILAEIAVAATDLAEALGTILGLNLLFGIPLLWGCALAAMDTFLFLAIQRFGVRKMEAGILALVATIGACFIIEIFLAQPDWKGVAQGFIPKMDSSAIYIVIGIIGATVMPHNLYLHSSLVQSRAVSNTLTGKREACRFNFYDALIALNLAFFVNAAIYIMSAANFHSRGIVVTEIAQAHELLDKILGPQIAPIAFGVALLAAGQSSTITGTLSGQIVMEGFLNLRIRPWLRRLITRCIALIPAVIAISYFGDKASYQLLIGSQVILSLQLPFAIIPLLHFTSDRKKMGGLANALWIKILGWTAATAIIALNLKLVYDRGNEWLHGASGWNLAFAIIPTALLLAVLVYLILRPLLRPSKLWESGKEMLSRDVAQRIQPSAPFQHIGVALERSPEDAHTLSQAISLAQLHKARITLLHVVDTPGTLVYGNESESQHGQDDHAYLEELAREIEERDLPVEFALGYGQIVPQLIRLSNECGLDLLLLGSHGHTGISDVLLGETVDSVRHGLTIPVMIVR